MSHQTQNHQDDITVETLRTPALQIQPAPIGKRALAAFLDSLIIGIIWGIPLIWIKRPFVEQMPREAAYLAALALTYYVVQEGTFASTIGKHLLRIRVVGNSGDPVSLRESLVRNLMRFVDWLPLVYGLGVASIAVSDKRQRLGDRVAGTIVTLAPEKDINPPPAPFLFH